MTLCINALHGSFGVAHILMNIKYPPFIYASHYLNIEPDD